MTRLLVLKMFRIRQPKVNGEFRYYDGLQIISNQDAYKAKKIEVY